jgi:acyl carrier protein
MIDFVMECIKQVMRQNGRPESTLNSQTDILRDTSLDSLDLAQVIVMLEEKTGNDPFAKGFINFRTVEELARLYE